MFGSILPAGGYADRVAFRTLRHGCSLRSGQGTVRDGGLVAEVEQHECTFEELSCANCDPRYITLDRKLALALSGIIMGELKRSLAVKKEPFASKGMLVAGRSWQPRPHLLAVVHPYRGRSALAAPAPPCALPRHREARAGAARAAERAKRAAGPFEPRPPVADDTASRRCRMRPHRELELRHSATPEATALSMLGFIPDPHLP